MKNNILRVTLSIFGALIISTIGLSAGDSETNDINDEYYTSNFSLESQNAQGWWANSGFPNENNMEQTHGVGYVGLTDTFICLILPFFCPVDNYDGIVNGPDEGALAAKLASVAGSINGWAKINLPDDQVCEGGSEAQMIASTQGIVDNLLGGVTLTTYMNGVMVESSTDLAVSTGMLGVDVFLGGNAYAVKMTTTLPYNQIGLSYVSLVSAVSAVTFVEARCSNSEYRKIDDGIFTSKYKEYEIEGAGFFQFGIPSSSEFEQYTNGAGFFGLTDILLCSPLGFDIACKITNYDGIAGDHTEPTQMGKLASVIGSSNIYAKINIPEEHEFLTNGECPAGSEAEAIIDTGGLVDEFISLGTVKTWLKGVEQEEIGMNRMFASLPAFGIMTDTQRSLRFISTKPYDTVSVSFASLATVLSETSFYYMACSMPGAEAGVPYVYTREVDDMDGDGASNDEEIDLGTSSVNPCDQMEAYPSAATDTEAGYDVTNETWKAADCDGTGGTNGEEIANGTDPYVDEGTDGLDSDGDGATDAEEDANGTSNEDSCDQMESYPNPATDTSRGYNVHNEVWMAADCDDDGETNGEEVDAGTNPYVANSLLNTADLSIAISSETTNIEGISAEFKFTLRVQNNSDTDRTGATIVKILKNYDVEFDIESDSEWDLTKGAYVYSLEYNGGDFTASSSKDIIVNATFTGKGVGKLNLAGSLNILNDTDSTNNFYRYTIDYRAVGN
jgi:hypothetical protein